MKKILRNANKIFILLALIWCVFIPNSSNATKIEKIQTDTNECNIKITADKNIQKIYLYKKNDDGKYVLFYKKFPTSTLEQVVKIPENVLSTKTTTDIKVVVIEEDGDRNEKNITADKVQPIPTPSASSSANTTVSPSPSTSTSPKPSTSTSPKPSTSTSPSSSTTTTLKTTLPSTLPSQILNLTKILSLQQVQSIKLDKTSLNLEVGNTGTLKATITPKNIKTKLRWSTSNKNIATIDSNGKVKAVSPGSCQIAVQTSNGKKATCTINVTFRGKSLGTGDKVYFIDVESADCMLLYSEGKYAMIDTGTNGSTDTNRVKKYLQDLGVTQLEWVLISHFDIDHWGGYSSINSTCKIKAVYLKKVPSRGGYSSIRNMAEKAGTKVYLVGDNCNTIKFGNFSFRLYNLVDTTAKYGISRQNINSIVAVATVNNKRIAFMGDLTNTGSGMTSSQESRATTICNNLAKQIGKVDIYKVAHHGYNGNTELEMSYYRPTYAILPNNYFPSSSIKNRIKKYVDNNYYIDGTGTVIMNITTGGKVTFSKLANNT